VQLRVVKDDYDFASGLFYSVQERGCVLGAIAFRSNGGDKHPSLDPVRDGVFHLTRLYAGFFFPIWEDTWQVLADGKPLHESNVSLPLSTRICIDAGSCMLCLQVRTASFGKESPRLRFVRDGSQARLDLALFEASGQQTLRWSDVNEAGCSFTLTVEDRHNSLAHFDKHCAAMRFAATQVEERTHLVWQSPAAPLELTVERRALPVAEMDAAYDAGINGKAIPLERLSDVKILQPAPHPRGSAASG